MAKTFNNLKQILSLEDTLNYGKYAEFTLKEIIDDNYDYFIWLRKIGLKVTAEVKEYALHKKYGDSNFNYSNTDVVLEEDIPY